MIKIENPLGTVDISQEFFSVLVGKVASSCFGVSGMATSSPAQDLRSFLLMKDTPDKGVRVRSDNGKLVIDLHIIVMFGVNISAIVKSIVNSQTGEVKNIEPQKKETVISKETSEKVLSMMQSVVAEGTGKNAQVKGYSIGGKTGTSEDGVNTGKYVTSFVGVAPISDPKLVILITLYNPTGEGGHQGGGVAAPIASQVLGEVLPYLEVKKDNEKEEDAKNKVAVPNLEGMTIGEAKKVLKDLNLNLEYNEENTENEEERIITEQVPVSGVEVLEESSIIVK